MNAIQIMNSREAKKLIFAERISEPERLAYGVYLGETEIYRIPFMLDYGLLVNPHMSVIGTSGSGKSYFIKSALMKYSAQFGTAATIIDWTGEYDDVVRFAGGKVINLGEDNVNISKLLYGTCSTNEEAFQLICDLTSATNAEKRELAPLAYGFSNGSALKDEETVIGLSRMLAGHGQYGRSIAEKLQHIAALNLFAPHSDANISIKEGLASLNLKMLPNDLVRKRVSHAILNMLANAMHSLKPDGNANSMVIIDEAWRMLDSTYNIGTFFREARKYGLRIVAATQLLADLGPEVLFNSATVVVFKTSNPSDIEMLLNMGIITGNDVQRIREMQVGECMVYLAGKTSGELPKRFFIRKIDGMGIKEYIIKVRKVKKYIEQSRMIEVFENIGVSGQVLSSISASLDQITDEIEIEVLVSKLLSAGLSRQEAVISLRMLGFSDAVIVNAYNRASTERDLHGSKNEE